MHHITRFLVAQGTILALGSSACGPGDAASAPAAVVVDAGESFGGQLPAPQDAPVLTFAGGAGTPNDGTDISLDLTTLERLHREQWTVFEPFVDADVTFIGVPFSVLLDEVGVPEGATTATLTALDEFQVTIAIEDLMAGDVLLVTRDETPGIIGVDRGGPIRFVWRDGSQQALNPDLWIWSLRTVVLT